MARLDRLAPAKEVAQLAAVLGRTFGRELLAAVSPLGRAALDDALDRLVDAELLYRRGLAPDETFEFKHALVRDAAYQSLLKSARRQHHGRIAQVIEERFAETAETQPELLAEHFTEASLVEQAVAYWQRAGRRAAERSANAEAIAHLTKGLSLLETLPETSDRDKQELALQIVLGPALMSSKGTSTPEVEQAYVRARELGDQVGDDSQRFAAQWGLWFFNLARARFETCERLVGDLIATSERQSDTELVLEAHHAAWATDFLLGELGSCTGHTEQGRRLYDRHEHRLHKFHYGGHDPLVCGLTFEGAALCLLGYPDQAAHRANEAMDLAKEMAHPDSSADAFLIGAWIHQFRRDASRCGEWADAAVRLTQEHELPYWLALATPIRGYSVAARGQAEEGIAQMRQGLTALIAFDIEEEAPYFRALLAEVLGQVGQVEEAIALLNEALAFVDKTGERFWEAEVHRLKGELLLKRSASDKDTADAAFNEALKIARRQEAKLLELRAATSLARLWGENGRREEAREVLAPVYGWFTEGFETADLRDAKALLDGLR